MRKMKKVRLRDTNFLKFTELARCAVNGSNNCSEAAIHGTESPRPQGVTEGPLHLD